MIHFKVKVLRAGRTAMVLHLGLLFFALCLPDFAAGSPSENPPDLVAAAAPVPAARISRWGATWRSALVPGWGQWYRGQPWLAAGYLALAAGSAGSLEYYNLAGDSSYSRYKGASTPSDAANLYSQTTGLDGLYTASSWTLLSIYGVNVLDALIFTRPSQGKTAWSSPALPSVAACTLPGHALGLSLKWQI